MYNVNFTVEFNLSIICESDILSIFKVIILSIALNLKFIVVLNKIYFYQIL
jgi:hypothetical protein